MLDIKLIREEPKKVKEGIKKRGVNPKLVDDFLAKDNDWREATAKLGKLQSKQKEFTKEGKRTEGKKNKEKIQKIKLKQKEAEEERQEILEELPNIPTEDAPVGGEKANRTVKTGGKIPKFSFEPKDHLTLGEQLEIIDTKHAATASGSRFAYLKRGAAILEIALIQYAFDNLTKAGFEPVFPPVMVKPEIMKEMGKGKFVEEKEAFHLEEDNLYLVGSAEHSLGPLGKNTVFNLKDLPKKYAGFSTSFRREAGSYGKDTKGILRVHQFDKVEQYVFCEPKDSDKELEKLVAMQEKLVGGLGLPYRIVEIATGDMTWGDRHQFDIEAWLPSQDTYREMGSASNTADFQARGINARYRDKNNQLTFVHTLNATGLAMGRIIIAIIENYQTAEGTIKIPEALQKHTFGVKTIS